MIRLVRPGDWLVLCCGALFVIFLFAALGHPDGADRVLIRKGGGVFGTYSLSRNREIRVAGPLGVSLISISGGAVRVEKDPGPHQNCVRQGWLRHAGEVAICLPNEVSIELLGGKKHYDSISY